MTRHVLVVAMLLVAGPAQAADFKQQRLTNWHHWRGPNANGTAPTADPPIHWDATKNMKWKAPLAGSGSSTPIVWGDQVFVTTAVRTDRVASEADRPKKDPRFETKTDAPKNYYRFEVLCLDRATGAVRWRDTAAEEVPHEGHHTTHSYAAGSPTTDGQRLYVSFGSFGVFCYDLAGKRLWQRDFGRLHTRFGWGEAVTPVIYQDRLLLNWDQEEGSALICVDAATGADRWRAPRNEKSTWTTPLIVTHGGRTLAVLNGNNRVRAHDVETGREVWQLGGMTVNPIPSAVASGDVLYVMSGYQGSAARAVRLGGTGDLTDTAQVLWKHDRGTPYVPSPLLAGGRLYFTQANQNLLTILDAATGKPTLDRARLPGVTSFYASPIAAAGRIYLVDRNGTSLVLKQGDSLQVLATNKLDDQIDASPVAVGKQLFLRGVKFLYCIAE